MSEPATATRSSSDPDASVRKPADHPPADERENIGSHTGKLAFLALLAGIETAWIAGIAYLVVHFLR